MFVQGNSLLFFWKDVDFLWIWEDLVEINPQAFKVFIR